MPYRYSPRTIAGSANSAALVPFNLPELLFQDAIDPFGFFVQAAEPSERIHPGWSGGFVSRRIPSAPVEGFPHRLGEKIFQGHAPFRGGSLGLPEKNIGYFHRGLHRPIFPQI